MSENLYTSQRNYGDDVPTDVFHNIFRKLSDFLTFFSSMFVWVIVKYCHLNINLLLYK